jgi:hypothetical protein
MDASEIKRLAEQIAGALSELKGLSRNQIDHNIKLIAEIIHHQLRTKGFTNEQILDLQLALVSSLIDNLQKEQNQ